MINKKYKFFSQSDEFSYFCAPESRDNKVKNFNMDIHEYQGKEILASYGVKVQRGYVANNPQEAVAAAKQLTAETGTGWHVIKAQVHAGGRGKGGGF